MQNGLSQAGVRSGKILKAFAQATPGGKVVSAQFLDEADLGGRYNFMIFFARKGRYSVSSV